MMQQNNLDYMVEQLQALRSFTDARTRMLQDFTRRLELILSQDHKKITVRDQLFPSQFTFFCNKLRTETDGWMEFWQETRKSIREGIEADQYALTLATKSFASRAKTLSRSSDEFTTAYDGFCRFYKNYTLAKLPVWLLTSCCDDLNNLTSKILFLSRELSKKTERN